jgi:hypothetical protein
MRERERNVAVVLDDEAIRSLDRTVAKFGEPTLYVVVVQADKRVAVEGVEGFLQLVGEPGRGVSRFALGSSGGTQQRAHVRIGGETWAPPVEYELEGPEDLVDAASDEMERWISDARPPWSPIATDWSWQVAVTAFLATTVGVVIAHFFSGSHTGSRPPDREVLGAFALSLPLMALFWWVFQRTRGALFPRLTIEVGRGERRAEFLRWARRALLLSLLGALGGWMVTVLKAVLR